MFQVSPKVIDAIEKSLDSNPDLKRSGIRVAVKDFDSEGTRESVSIGFEHNFHKEFDEVVRVKEIPFIIRKEIFEEVSLRTLDFEDENFVLKVNTEALS